jgi:hypothetical protein
MNLDRTLIGQIKDPILRKLFEHIARDGLNADDVKAMIKPESIVEKTYTPPPTVENPPPDDPDQPHFPG